MLNPDNYLVFAMNHYENHCIDSLLDFQKDLNKPMYIRRLFKKYKNGVQIDERLLLNHFVIFFNAFENKAAVSLLFFLTPEEYYKELVAVLKFLNKLPEIVMADKLIITEQLGFNVDLYNRLKQL